MPLGIICGGTHLNIGNKLSSQPGDASTAGEAATKNISSPPVSPSIPPIFINFSDVKLKNAYSGLREADLPIR